MKFASNAVTNMYRLDAPQFSDRVRTMELNVKRQLLEEFVREPGPSDTVLARQSAVIIQAQKGICHDAEITNDQKQDFESRIDRWIANAIITIRRVLTDFPDPRSASFQLEATKQLGLPVA